MPYAAPTVTILISMVSTYFTEWFESILHDRRIDREMRKVDEVVERLLADPNSSFDARVEAMNQKDDLARKKVKHYGERANAAIQKRRS